MERTTMTDSRWYSPENVVSHFHNDLDFPIKPTKINRKAEEFYTASIALIGIQKHENKQYWIQPVADTEQSPDVRTIALYDRTDGKAPDAVIQEIEIVSYEFSSDESLPEFLLRTKVF